MTDALESGELSLQMLLFNTEREVLAPISATVALDEVAVLVNTARGAMLALLADDGFCAFNLTLSAATFESAFLGTPRLKT